MLVLFGIVLTMFLERIPYVCSLVQRFVPELRKGSSSAYLARSGVRSQENWNRYLLGGLQDEVSNGRCCAADHEGLKDLDAHFVEAPFEGDTE